MAPGNLTIGGLPLSRTVEASLEIANDQFTTGAASATAVAARDGRKRVTLKNTSSTAAEIIYVGFGTVSAANGMPLLVGESISIESTAAISAIAASGTPALAYIEEYN
jgi:hypothetical protein